jgi:hypothetical protein
MPISAPKRVPAANSKAAPINFVFTPHLLPLLAEHGDGHIRAFYFSNT